jgi:hypothetical protein
VRDIQHTQEWETRKERYPEENIAEYFVFPYRWSPSYRNQWHLDELGKGSQQSVNGPADIWNYLTCAMNKYIL